MIVIKSPDEIEHMRKAGRIVATVLHELGNEIRPGVTTAGLASRRRDLAVQGL